MVFVMILIRINSSETSAACAAGVGYWFIHYSAQKVNPSEPAVTAGQATVKTIVLT